MGRCVLGGCECPETSDPKAKRYCPAWSEDGLVWENIQSGDQKVMHCGIAMLPYASIEVVKASNRPAAEVASVRNEMTKGFQELVTAVGLASEVSRQQALRADEKPEAIESKEEGK